ncbi:MAG: DUF692 domain-containing protein, partial [Candidatus Margulisbacteria bacterium]|nr:DUF692 domain-containing protein [Candidatus Margulisiibacteriota bacterium]
MKTPVSQKVAQHLSTARRTTVLPPRVLDSLAQANIRFSYTRDLRRANSNQNFTRLFQNDPRLVRREIVNWNLAEKEDKASPNYMPDEQTSVHLTMLFDAADKNTFCNLANPEAMDYLTDAHSRFFRFMRVRDFESVSLHLGFAAEELTKDPLDLHSVPQSKVLSRLEMMAHTLYSLLGLKRNLDEVGYSGKLLIETLDYQVDRVGEEDVSAYEHITDPGFLAEVLGRTGYGLLFDAAHLLISAENMGYAGHLQYVEAMLGGKGEDLHEIHLAVP